MPKTIPTDLINHATILQHFKEDVVYATADIDKALRPPAGYQTYRKVQHLYKDGLVERKADDKNPAIYCYWITMKGLKYLSDNVGSIQTPEQYKDVAGYQLDQKAAEKASEKPSADLFGGDLTALPSLALVVTETQDMIKVLTNLRDTLKPIVEAQ